MDRKEKAVEYKHSGCNCCQAVLMAFADELNVSEDTLKQAGACFGVGMGCMEATCGALCGAQMVLGMKKYEGRPMLGQAKEMHEAFKSLSGATICGDLKGAKNGVVICSCDDCVRNGVTIAEKCL